MIQRQAPLAKGPPTDLRFGLMPSGAGLWGLGCVVCDRHTSLNSRVSVWPQHEDVRAARG